MEKDLIFFGEAGLTSTSANFIANLAKEKYSSITQALESVVFYDTSVKLLGTSETTVLKEGVLSVAGIEPNLKKVAQLKRLIAWLREAIKAKERLIKEAQNGDYEYYSIPIPERPECEAYISSDDVIATFNIKQRDRYYYLEAYCATIGEYIHPSGTFAQERKHLQDIIHEPNEVTGNGRDTLIYTRKPSLPVDQVEDTFMSLQQTYREYQAELNSIKHQIEETVNQDTAKKNIEYSEKVSAYKTEMAAADAELTRKRKEAVTAASNLKIIIPDSLKDIYDDIKELGKD